MKWALTLLPIPIIFLALFVWISPSKHQVLSASKTLPTGYYALSESTLSGCKIWCTPLQPDGFVYGPFPTLAETYLTLNSCQKDILNHIVYIPPSLVVEKKA